VTKVDLYDGYYMTSIDDGKKQSLTWNLYQRGEHLGVVKSLDEIAEIIDSRAT